MHSAQPFRNGFKETVIAIILRDVVEGLAYLHNLGYVHRSVRSPLVSHRDILLRKLDSLVELMQIALY